MLSFLWLRVVLVYSPLLDIYLWRKIYTNQILHIHDSGSTNVESRLENFVFGCSQLIRIC